MSNTSSNSSSNTPNNPHPEQQPTTKWKTLRLHVGWTLLVLSFVPWLLLLVLPFVGVSLSQGGAWAGGAVIGAEILFYAGVLLVGKEAYQAVKRRVSQWFMDIASRARNKRSEP